jgi:primosomal protein N' (replication factor Y)
MGLTTGVNFAVPVLLLASDFRPRARTRLARIASVGKPSRKSTVFVYTGAPVHFHRRPAAGIVPRQAQISTPMIAEVALNVPMRRTFDYRVPAALAEAHPLLGPGSRVVVPFGPRLKGGIVVSLKEHSEVPEARLKAVQRATEGEPLFTPETLAFTRWISEYYLCGWGEVLEAALPSGLGVKLRTLYALRKASSGAADELEALSVPARKLIEGGEWDASRWERSATPEDQAWLRRNLRPGGAVVLRQEFAGTRAKVRLELWLRLTAKGLHPPESEPKVRGRRSPGRTSKREAILRLLREEGELPLARVQAVVGAPGDALRRLKAEGWVAESLRPAPRVSATGMAGPQDFLALNAAQQAANDVLRDALSARVYQGFLLQGVTGSGKTEVYLHAVREALSQGRSALVLVPEIALTADMVRRFQSRFGETVAVLHSGLPEGERFEAWNAVRSGAARIVVGARSAVFAPLANLGLVIVDEEHDGSYKQDETPRYHGRDGAMWRASRAGAVLVLGTATPSLESAHNVTLGKLTRLRLPGRIESRPLPPVELVDLRTSPRQTGSALFSLKLMEALRETLLRKEQAILFLNRRGFASLIRCSACQVSVLCENCTLALTWHQAEGRLRCHRCDYNRTLPATCPACGSAEMKILGLGTERVAEELALAFPEARQLRVDSDSLRRRGELERMLEGIRQRRFDLIIGTQVLSKGHDFPAITLVGAILADVALNLPDFRAPERTFQLLTQIAGRAGRGDRPGRVLIQTYNPAHYALTHVLDHDPDAFAAQELDVRQRAGVPPFASQVLLWASSPSERDAAVLAEDLAKRLIAAAAPEVEVLGPAEAAVKRMAGRWRWMVLLKGPRIGPLQRAARHVLDDPAFKPGHNGRVAVDVDPYSVV